MNPYMRTALDDFIESVEESVTGDGPLETKIRDLLRDAWLDGAKQGVECARRIMLDEIPS